MHSFKPILGWSTSQFYCSSLLTQRVVTWQFLPALLWKSAQNLLDWEGLSCEGLFRSTHRCAAGFSWTIVNFHLFLVAPPVCRGLDEYFGTICAAEIGLTAPLSNRSLKVKTDIHNSSWVPPPWLRLPFQVKNSPKSKSTLLWLLGHTFYHFFCFYLLKKASAVHQSIA